MPFELPEHVLETIERLRSELARKRGSTRNRRRRDRAPLKIPCMGYVFGQRTGEIHTHEATTLNISRGGLGLVVRKCFLQDEPIEVRICLPNRSPLYLAGLVRFCMYLSDGFFEIGVQLMSAGDLPIFSADPLKAVRELPWLATAIRRRAERSFSINRGGAHSPEVFPTERLVR